MTDTHRIADKLEAEHGFELDSSEVYPDAVIKVSRDQYSAFEVKRMVEETKELVLAPDFQRRKVWGTEQKQELIESLLMGIPIPVIYVFENELGIKQMVDSTRIKLSFVMGELGEVSPLNTGAGNSYLLKLLIMCLTARPGHLLLIENPEIHLHPGAQSRLGEFFAFLASRGVQLVVETHCEHLINRVRYEVYHKRLKADDALVYYKQSSEEGFLPETSMTVT
jgi:predicted ATPase